MEEKINEKSFDTYHPETDPKVMRYWMRQGSKTAAFLFVIPGCAILGYGIGLLASRALPYSVIGFGAGFLAWDSSSLSAINNGEELTMRASARKPYRGISMEGGLASWYAKTARKDFGEYERLAQELAKDLPPAARVLEVAPGPGFLSVALAKLGRYKITGLDISQSFVRMASEYAKGEGVTIHFIHGSASDIPFEEGFFDLVVCRAAFKNFTEPLEALNEMHRVLKPGGRTLIIDLRKDSSWDEITSYVDRLRLGRINAWMIKMTFKHMLLKRAYTVEQMESLASSSDFKSCEIIRNPLGMEVRLLRRQPVAEQAA